MSKEKKQSFMKIVPLCVHFRNIFLEDSEVNDALPSKLAKIPFRCVYIFISCKRDRMIPTTQTKFRDQITITVAFGRCSFVPNQFDFSAIPWELTKVVHLLYIV